jgi:hypothetical protein
MSDLIGWFILVPMAFGVLTLVIADYCRALLFEWKDLRLVLTDIVLLILLDAVLFYASWKLITAGTL